MTLSTEQIEEIKTDAAENWKGNLDLAIAAFVHGLGVVRFVGWKVPAWANKRQLANYKGQITKAVKTVKAVAAPKPKKAKAAKKVKAPTR